MTEWWNKDKKVKDRGAPISGYSPRIKDWEIEKGGWRSDEDNHFFWLSWEELLEFERQNDFIKDNDDFWGWFRKFRKEHDITSASSSWSRSKTKHSTWDGEWEEEDYKSKKGGWLSGWWAKDVYKGWSGATTSDSRLAIAMQAVRGVVRVIDDTLPPMICQWAASEDSYTDFASKIIAINPAPITEGKLDDAEAVEVTTGFALHEASHSQYSREPYETLKEPTLLSPMQVAGILLNIAEDIRIEGKTMDVFPGFTGYFEKTLEWVWGKTSQHTPKTYGPSLQDKINGMFTIVRFPDKVAEVLTDASFAPEIPWWTNWRDDYLEGRVNARETVERGLEHLREPTEKEKSEGKDKSNSQAAGEMDEMAKAEEKLKEELKNLKKFIDEMINKGAKDLLHGRGCAAKVDRKALPRETAERVRQLLDEDYRKANPTVPAPSGMSKVTLAVTHPKESTRSKAAYIGKPAAIVQKLKAALLFRQELPRYADRLLKNGNLDDDELWRFAAKDYRVFSEEIIQNRPKVQLGLLVDLSGSMHGYASGSGRSKLSIAQELAQLIILTTKQMDGVHADVHGHTANLASSGDPVQIYRIWEEGEPVSRLGLIDTLPHVNNYDGFAIEYCVKQLIARGEPDEQRVLIVLSDGYPAGAGYGGGAAERHMMSVSDWAEKHGVTVIQIAIDDELRPDAQARMFKHWVPFTSMNELPNKLARLMAKIL